MAAFSYNQQQFVLDSFLVPNTSNNMLMHSISHDNHNSTQTTTFTTETCFPHIPPNHHHQSLQEIPLHPQIHETSTVKLSSSCTSSTTTDLSFIVKQGSVSSAMVGELAGGDQVSQVGFSSMDKKRKSMEMKVEMVGKGDEKERKYSGNPRKAEDRRVKRAPKKQKKVPEEVPSGFVHVRARRGQATDSHSLAERVRRQKISVRMKLLQSLVPGCDKVTGKALILDEIIKYVQTLQSQVEYLAAKLTSVNPTFNDFDLDFDTNTLTQEKTCCLDFQLPHVLESNSTQLTSFPEKITTLNSQLLPLDQEQRSNISFQDNYNLLWGTDSNRKHELANYCGLDGWSSL
ncbi:hypothetical protein Patl1_17016 [Pistacia atlantica]|uniref:Uncharacterized protein n=1 Tax=Pistacia atlantica TaxID=434234 RepID=A0ACC1B7F3_9ROSI|nr:hypothetical protein Patl1_17016 [Pistacia atlantica]